MKENQSLQDQDVVPPNGSITDVMKKLKKNIQVTQLTLFARQIKTRYSQKFLPPFVNRGYDLLKNRHQKRDMKESLKQGGIPKKGKGFSKKEGNGKVLKVKIVCKKKKKKNSISTS